MLTATKVHTAATVICFPLMFAFGLSWWSGGISRQTRLARHAPQQRPQAIGLHFSAQFLGVAIGGALGGAVLSGFGPIAVPVVGAAIAALTVLSVRQTAPSPAAGA
ncbi:MFS transporter [Actinacidiphila oryziradicis]|uniref:MFS transporter n=1 Tax=Actinacidiphila oryziradicis TaxID=2571141 RepID=A0A4U0S259_9ACTN|nr:MFS transporter [Actinacidiphila oryziradicis]TKA02922.1 MFS transporter [Actinacidiphila oryziradicis]